PIPSVLIPTCVLLVFTDPATTQIYTLSLHDALPISPCRLLRPSRSRYASPSSARCRAELVEMTEGHCHVDWAGWDDLGVDRVGAGIARVVRVAVAPGVRALSPGGFCADCGARPPGSPASSRPSSPCI